MKIIVGNYTIEGTTYNWDLIKTEEYVNDKGENKVRTERWYYPKLEQALQRLLDERFKDLEIEANVVDNLGTVISALKEVKEEVLGAIRN